MFGLALTLVLGVADAPVQPAPVADAGVRQAAMIARLVERADPAAIDYVRQVVEGGAHPATVASFLEAARLHPNQAFTQLLIAHTKDRRHPIRARALLALAQLSEARGQQAAWLAMDDPVLGIRLLGLDLADKFTAPDLEEARLKLIDRDPEVARAIGWAPAEDDH